MKRPKKLTATFVGAVKAPGRYGDGYGSFGLSLLVKPTASGRLSKTWCQRVRIDGVPRNLGLGVWPIVTLAEARTKAIENRRAIAQGHDPRVRSHVPTFRQAAERVIRVYEPTWKPGGNSDSARVWRSSLERFVFPRFGDKPINTVTSRDVVSVLEPIWTEKRETARRVRQRIGKIMKWAVAQEFRHDNPAGEAITEALPKDSSPAGHHRALPHAEVGAALRAIRESDAWTATKLCFEFLVLTAARSGEAREATWNEVDLLSRTWEIPGSRTKSGRPHRVPLSVRALKVVEEARQLTGGSGLLFPSARDMPLSNNTTSKLLRELGIDATTHGFRTSFRTWAAENGVSREVAEASLAHVNPNRVESAYQRSDLFTLRADLMERWARYLAASPTDTNRTPVRLHRGG